MRPFPLLVTSCTLALCALVAPAQAQEVSAARTMFDGGLADMEAGRFEKGCPALEASYKLDPRPGTLFTLAECEAQWGHIATAVTRYDDYISMYAQLTAQQRQRQGDRLETAQRQKSVLSPRVPHLALSLPPGAPHGATVWRDGTALEPSMLGVALAVDPGEHAIVVTAPGRAERRSSVNLQVGKKASITLEVGAVVADEAAIPVGKTEVIEVPGPRKTVVPGIVVGAVGLAAIAAGAGLFAASQGKRQDTFDLAGTIGKRNGNCVSAPIDKDCAQVKDLAKQSDTLHNVAIGAFVSGGILAVGALTLILLPPPTVKKTVIQSGKIQVTPVVGAERGGMIVSGAF